MPNAHRCTCPMPIQGTCFCYREPEEQGPDDDQMAHWEAMCPDEEAPDA